MEVIRKVLEDEALRLRALQEQNILDTPEAAEFDNLCALAAQICEVPFAQINFLDETRTWSKAKYGIPTREIPREITFCNTTITLDVKLVVEDASLDERFRHFPFVEGEPGIRFYAGYNIKGDYNTTLGTICVLDTQPKVLTEAQHTALETLAKEVESRLELQRKNYVLETVTTFLESSIDMMMVVDPETMILERCSSQVKNFFGVDEPCGGKLFITDIFPDATFIYSIQKWDKGGAEEPIRPIVRFVNRKGETEYYDVSVKKQFGKWFMAAHNVTNLIKSQGQLEKALSEKNVLMTEIHHRVKNNLAVISGILQLEELKSDSEEVQQALYSNYMRVKSMALIHEEMYKEQDFSNIRFDEYLNNFAKGLATDKRSDSRQIEIDAHLVPVYLNLNQAVPSALIVNELVANCYDFAFEGRNEGKIELGIEFDGTYVTLIVKDNGIGLPQDFRLDNSPTLGTTLAFSYSEQLESKVDIKSSPDKGTEIRVKFLHNPNAKGSSASTNIRRAV